MPSLRLERVRRPGVGPGVAGEGRDALVVEAHLVADGGELLDVPGSNRPLRDLYSIVSCIAMVDLMISIQIPAL